MNTKKEILRAENIMYRDNDNKNDKFFSLFQLDIKNLIEEYFVLDDKINIKVNKENKNLIVCIGFSANSIKNFSNS